MIVRRAAVCVLACGTALFAGCAPSAQPGARPAAGALAERACLEAAAAETSAARKMAAYRASQTDFSAQQARLVELQRIRSRIATGRMSDEELAAWEVEPAPIQAAPAETTQPVVPAVTAPGDSVSVEQAAPTAESQESVTPAVESEQSVAPAAEPQENVAPAVEEQAPPTSESETTPAPDAETAPADSTAPGGEGSAE